MAGTDAEPLDPIRELLAVEAIKGLKARYFRFMDEKNWDALRSLFTADALTDTTDSGGVVSRSADEFVARLRRFVGDVLTVHHGHMPEIVVTSATTASGVWAMEDMLRWPNGATLHGYGHYHETYECLGGEWRISSMTLTRLRTDTTPPAEN